MDNNSFEQQFTKNVQQAAATQPTITPTTNATKNAPMNPAPSRIPWLIIAGLSFIILLQTIALIIFLTNYIPDASENDEGADSSDSASTIYDDPNFTYDNDKNLTAFNLVCTSNNSNYTFTTDNKYTSPSGSGTYSITNDDRVIILNGNANHTLYYDGMSIIDGITVFDCNVPDSSTSAE